MLNNAVEPHAGWLSEIARRAAAEWAILGALDESDLADARILYAAAYTLIRSCNTVVQHSRRLANKCIGQRALTDWRITFYQIPYELHRAG